MFPGVGGSTGEEGKGGAQEVEWTSSLLQCPLRLISGFDFYLLDSPSTMEVFPLSAYSLKLMAFLVVRQQIFSAIL